MRSIQGKGDNGTDTEANLCNLLLSSADTHQCEDNRWKWPLSLLWHSTSSLLNPHCHLSDLENGIEMANLATNFLFKLLGALLTALVVAVVVVGRNKENDSRSNLHFETIAQSFFFLHFSWTLEVFKVLFTEDPLSRLIVLSIALSSSAILATISRSALADNALLASLNCKVSSKQYTHPSVNWFLQRRLLSDYHHFTTILIIYAPLPKWRRGQQHRFRFARQFKLSFVSFLSCFFSRNTLLIFSKAIEKKTLMFLNFIETILFECRKREKTFFLI